MINQTLAYFPPRLFELILIFFACGSWLLLIILPILYAVHSIKTRRRILTEIEKLAADVSVLRQQVKGTQKPNE